MKLSNLIDTLLEAQASVFDCYDSDPEVVLAFEPSTLEEGFDWKSTEGISDIRIADHWPLPGASIITPENEKPSKVIIFYDNHFNLADSSIEEVSEPAVVIPKKERPTLEVGQRWKTATGEIVVVNRYDSYGPGDKEPFYCNDGYWYTSEGKAYRDDEDETTLFSTLEELVED